MPILRKSLAAVLAAVQVVFGTALGHAAEANIWAERRKNAQAQGETAPLLAAAPAAFALPSAQPVPLALGAADDRVTRALPSSFLRQQSALFTSLPQGSVRKAVVPKNWNGKTVVLLQDVHLNIEAQESLGAALQSLIQTDRVGLVALEGVFRPVKLERFRAFPVAGALRPATDFLLKEGKISGAVHALLTAPGRTPAALGVDDPSGYAANVEAYRRSAALQPGHRKRLAEMTAASARRLESGLNPALKAFHGRWAAHHAGKLSLGDYVETLPRGARPAATVERFTRALAMERALDFSRVEGERAKLLRALVDRLSRAQLADLTGRSVAYRAGQISHAAFYGHLKEVCRGAGTPLSAYPAMNAYLDYVLTADAIDPDALLAEISALEDAAFKDLAKTSEEKALVAEARQLLLAGKLLEFTLTPEEWGEWNGTQDIKGTPHPALSHKGRGEKKRTPGGGDTEISSEKQIQHLDPGLRRGDAGDGDPGLRRGDEVGKISLTSGGTSLPPPHPQAPPSTAIPYGWGRELDLSSFEEFYREADGRSGAMTRNLLKGMKEAGASVAVLVTGGFHGGEMTERIAAEGAACLVFTPRLTRVDEKGSGYLSAFTREKTPLENLFEGRKLTVTPDPAQVEALPGLLLAGANRTEDRNDDQTLFDGTLPEDMRGRIMAEAHPAAGNRVALTQGPVKQMVAFDGDGGVVDVKTLPPSAAGRLGARLWEAMLWAGRATLDVFRAMVPFRVEIRMMETADGGMSIPQITFHMAAAPESGAPAAAPGLAGLATQFSALIEDMLAAADKDDEKGFRAAYGEALRVVDALSPAAAAATDAEVLAALRSTGSVVAEKDEPLAADDARTVWREIGVRDFSPERQKLHQEVIEEVVEELFDDAGERKRWAGRLAQDLRTNHLGHWIPAALLDDFHKNRPYIISALAQLERNCASWGSALLNLHVLFLKSKIDDDVTVRVTLKHELVHHLAGLGVIKIPPQWESVTHAVDVLERVRQSGEASLADPAVQEEYHEPALQALYERGKKMGAAGETGFILRPGRSGRQAEYFGTDYLMVKAREVYEALGLNTDILTQAHLGGYDESYDAQRAVGILMAGILAGRKADEPNLKPLRLLKDFFEAAHARLATPSGEDLRKLGINPETGVFENRGLLKDVVDYISASAAKRLSPAILEQGLWQIDEKNGKLWLVPSNLFPRPWDGAQAWERARERGLGHGLLAYYRALLGGEQWLAASGRPLARDAGFRALWTQAALPSAVERAFSGHKNIAQSGALDKKFTGAEAWVRSLFEDRYDIDNADLAEALFTSLPPHLQFLDTLLYRWHARVPGSLEVPADPRLRNPAVQKAVAESFPGWSRALFEPGAFDPEAFYLLLEREVWPHYKALYDEALKQEELRRAYERSVKEDLGRMEREALEEYFNRLPQEVKDAIRQAAQQAMDQNLEEFMGGMAGPAGSSPSSQTGKPSASSSGPTQSPAHPASSATSAGTGSTGNMKDRLQALYQQAGKMEKLLQELSQGLQQARSTAEDAGRQAQQAAGEPGRAEARNQAEKAQAAAEDLQDQANDLLNEGRTTAQAAAATQQQAGAAQNALLSPEQGRSLSSNARDLAQEAQALLEKLEALQEKVNALAAQAGTMADTARNAPSLTNQLQEQARGIKEAAQEIKESLDGVKGGERRVHNLLDQVERAVERLQQSLQNQRPGGGNEKAPPTGGEASLPWKTPPPAAPAPEKLPSLPDNAKGFQDLCQISAGTSTAAARPRRPTRSLMEDFDLEKARQDEAARLLFQTGLNEQERAAYEMFRRPLKDQIDEMTEALSALLIPAQGTRLLTHRRYGPIFKHLAEAISGSAAHAKRIKATPLPLKISLMIDRSGSMNGAPLLAVQNTVVLMLETLFNLNEALEAAGFGSMPIEFEVGIFSDTNVTYITHDTSKQVNGHQRERIIYSLVKELKAQGGTEYAKSLQTYVKSMVDADDEAGRSRRIFYVLSDEEVQEGQKDTIRDALQYAEGNGVTVRLVPMNSGVVGEALAEHGEEKVLNPFPYKEFPQKLADDLVAQVIPRAQRHFAALAVAMSPVLDALYRPIIRAGFFRTAAVVAAVLESAAALGLRYLPGGWLVQAVVQSAYFFGIHATGSLWKWEIDLKTPGKRRLTEAPGPGRWGRAAFFGFLGVMFHLVLPELALGAARAFVPALAAHPHLVAWVAGIGSHALYNLTTRFWLAMAGSGTAAEEDLYGKPMPEPSRPGMKRLGDYRHFYTEETDGRHWVVYQKPGLPELRWERGAGGPFVPSKTVPDTDANEKLLLKMLRLMYREGAAFTSYSGDGQFMVRPTAGRGVELLGQAGGDWAELAHFAPSDPAPTASDEGIYESAEGIRWKAGEDGVLRLSWNGEFFAVPGLAAADPAAVRVKSAGPDKIFVLAAGRIHVLSLKDGAWSLLHSLRPEEKSPETDAEGEWVEMTGEPGLGKGTFARAVAHLMNENFHFLSGNEQMEVEELDEFRTLGNKQPGVSDYLPSVLNQVRHYGGIVMLDEIHKIPAEVVNSLKDSIAARSHPWRRPGAKGLAKVAEANHPRAVILATSNQRRAGIAGAAPSGDKAMKRRKRTVEFFWQHPDEERLTQLELARDFARREGRSGLDPRGLERRLAEMVDSLMGVAMKERLAFMGYSASQQARLRANWALLEDPEFLPEGKVKEAYNRAPSPRVVQNIIQHFIAYPNDWAYRRQSVILFYFSFDAERDKNKTFRNVLTDLNAAGLTDMTDGDQPLITRDSVEIRGGKLRLTPVLPRGGADPRWDPVEVDLHPDALAHQDLWPDALAYWMQAPENALSFYRALQARDLRGGAIIVGDPGSGKSTLVDLLRTYLSGSKLAVGMNAGIQKESLTWSPSLGESGAPFQTEFKPEVIPQAMNTGGHGKDLELGEINQAPPGVNALLNEVAQSGQLPIPGGGTVDSAPGFALWATMNRPGTDVDVQDLSDELLERYPILSFRPLPPEKALGYLVDAGQKNGLMVNPRLIGEPVADPFDPSQPLRSVDGDIAFRGLLRVEQVLRRRIAEDPRSFDRAPEMGTHKKIVRDLADNWAFMTAHEPDVLPQERLFRIYLDSLTLEGKREDRARWIKTLKKAFEEAGLWSDFAEAHRSFSHDGLLAYLNGEDVITQKLSIVRAPATGEEEMDRQLSLLQTNTHGAAPGMLIARLNGTLTQRFEKFKELSFEGKMRTAFLLKEMDQVLAVILAERPSHSKANREAMEDMRRALRSFLVFQQNWPEEVFANGEDMATFLSRYSLSVGIPSGTNLAAPRRRPNARHPIPLSAEETRSLEVQLVNIDAMLAAKGDKDIEKDALTAASHLETLILKWRMEGKVLEEEIQTRLFFLAENADGIGVEFDGDVEDVLRTCGWLSMEKDSIVTTGLESYDRNLTEMMHDTGVMNVQDILHDMAIEFGKGPQHVERTFEHLARLATEGHEGSLKVLKRFADQWSNGEGDSPARIKITEVVHGILDAYPDAPWAREAREKIGAFLPKAAVVPVVRESPSQSVDPLLDDLLGKLEVFHDLPAYGEGVMTELRAFVDGQGESLEPGVHAGLRGALAVLAAALTRRTADALAADARALMALLDSRLRPPPSEDRSMERIRAVEKRLRDMRLPWATPASPPPSAAVTENQTRGRKGGGVEKATSRLITPGERSDKPLIVSWDGKTAIEVNHQDAQPLMNAETGEPLLNQNGDPIKVGSGHGGRTMHAAAFSPTDPVVVTGANDDEMRLWDTRTGLPKIYKGQPIVLKGHGNGINAIAYSPDGKLIASASQDGTVRLWKAKTGEPVLGADNKPIVMRFGTAGSDGEEMTGVAFSPDGKTLAATRGGRRENALHAWDVLTGKAILVDGKPVALKLEFISNSPSGIDFTPDGKTIAVGNFNGNVQLFDAETWQPVTDSKGTPVVLGKNQKGAASTSATGAYAVQFTGPATLLVRDRNKGTREWTLPFLQKAAPAQETPIDREEHVISTTPEQAAEALVGLVRGAPGGTDAASALELLADVAENVLSALEGPEEARGTTPVPSGPITQSSLGEAFGPGVAVGAHMYRLENNSRVSDGARQKVRITFVFDEGNGALARVLFWRLDEEPSRAPKAYELTLEGRDVVRVERGVKGEPLFVLRPESYGERTDWGMWDLSLLRFVPLAVHRPETSVATGAYLRTSTPSAPTSLHDLVERALALAAERLPLLNPLPGAGDVVEALLSILSARTGPDTEIEPLREAGVPGMNAQPMDPALIRNLPERGEPIPELRSPILGLLCPPLLSPLGDKVLLWVDATRSVQGEKFSDDAVILYDYDPVQGTLSNPKTLGVHPNGLPDFSQDGLSILFPNDAGTSMQRNISDDSVRKVAKALAEPSLGELLATIPGTIVGPEGARHRLELAGSPLVIDISTDGPEDWSIVTLDRRTGKAVRANSISSRESSLPKAPIAVVREDLPGLNRVTLVFRDRDLPESAARPQTSVGNPGKQIQARTLNWTEWRTEQARSAAAGGTVSTAFWDMRQAVEKAIPGLTKAPGNVSSNAEERTAPATLGLGGLMADILMDAAASRTFEEPRRVDVGSGSGWRGLREGETFTLSGENVLLKESYTQYFSADGTRAAEQVLAAAGSDEEFVCTVITDVRSGRMIKALPNEHRSIEVPGHGVVPLIRSNEHVPLSPDGRLLAQVLTWTEGEGEKEKSVWRHVIWDVEKGTVLHVFPAAHGNYYQSPKADETIDVVLPSGKTVRTSGGDSGEFSPDGRYFLQELKLPDENQEGTAVWDMETGKMTHFIPDLASLEGDTLLVPLSKSEAEVVEFDLRNHLSPDLTHVANEAQLRWLDPEDAAAYLTRAWILRDLKTGRVSAILLMKNDDEAGKEVPNAQGQLETAFSPDGLWFGEAVAFKYYQGQQTYVWRTDTGEPVWISDPFDQMTAPSFLPGNRLAQAIQEDGAWHTATWQFGPVRPTLGGLMADILMDAARRLREGFVLGPVERQIREWLAELKGRPVTPEISERVARLALALERLSRPAAVVTAPATPAGRQPGKASIERHNVRPGDAKKGTFKGGRRWAIEMMGTATSFVVQGPDGRERNSLASKTLAQGLTQFVAITLADGEEGYLVGKEGAWRLFSANAGDPRGLTAWTTEDISEFGLMDDGRLWVRTGASTLLVIESFQRDAVKFILANTNGLPVGKDHKVVEAGAMRDGGTWVKFERGPSKEISYGADIGPAQGRSEHGIKELSGLWMKTTQWKMLDEALAAAGLPARKVSGSGATGFFSVEQGDLKATGHEAWELLERIVKFGIAKAAADGGERLEALWAEWLEIMTLIDAEKKLNAFMESLMRPAAGAPLAAPGAATLTTIEVGNTTSGALPDGRKWDAEFSPGKPHFFSIQPKSGPVMKVALPLNVEAISAFQVITLGNGEVGFYVEGENGNSVLLYEANGKLHEWNNRGEIFFAGVTNDGGFWAYLDRSLLVSKSFLDDPAEFDFEDHEAFDGVLNVATSQDGRHWAELTKEGTTLFAMQEGDKPFRVVDKTDLVNEARLILHPQPNAAPREREVVEALPRPLPALVPSMVEVAVEIERLERERESSLVEKVEAGRPGLTMENLERKLLLLGAEKKGFKETVYAIPLATGEVWLKVLDDKLHVIYRIGGGNKEVGEGYPLSDIVDLAVLPASNELTIFHTPESLALIGNKHLKIKRFTLHHEALDLGGPEAPAKMDIPLSSAALGIYKEIEKIDLRLDGAAGDVAPLLEQRERLAASLETPASEPAPEGRGMDRAAFMRRLTGEGFVYDPRGPSFSHPSFEDMNLWMDSEESDVLSFSLDYYTDSMENAIKPLEVMPGFIRTGTLTTRIEDRGESPATDLRFIAAEKTLVVTLRADAYDKLPKNRRTIRYGPRSENYKIRFERTPKRTKGSGTGVKSRALALVMVPFGWMRADGADFSPWLLAATAVLSVLGVVVFHGDWAREMGRRFLSRVAALPPSRPLLTTERGNAFAGGGVSRAFLMALALVLTACGIEPSDFNPVKSLMPVQVKGPDGSGMGLAYGPESVELVSSGVQGRWWVENGALSASFSPQVPGEDGLRVPVGRALNRIHFNFRNNENAEKIHLELTDRDGAEQVIAIPGKLTTGMPLSRGQWRSIDVDFDSMRALGRMTDNGVDLVRVDTDHIESLELKVDTGEGSAGFSVDNLVYLQHNRVTVREGENEVEQSFAPTDVRILTGAGFGSEGEPLRNANSGAGWEDGSLQWDWDLKAYQRRGIAMTVAPDALAGRTSVEIPVANGGPAGVYVARLLQDPTGKSLPTDYYVNLPKGPSDISLLLPGYGFDPAKGTELQLLAFDDLSPDSGKLLFRGMSPAQRARVLQDDAEYPSDQPWAFDRDHTFSKEDIAAPYKGRAGVEKNEKIAAGSHSSAMFTFKKGALAGLDQYVFFVRPKASTPAMWVRLDDGNYKGDEIFVGGLVEGKVNTVVLDLTSLKMKKADIAGLDLMVGNSGTEQVTATYTLYGLTQGPVFVEAGADEGQTSPSVAASSVYYTYDESPRRNEATGQDGMEIRNGTGEAGVTMRFSEGDFAGQKNLSFAVENIKDAAMIAVDIEGRSGSVRRGEKQFYVRDLAPGKSSEVNIDFDLLGFPPEEIVSVTVKAFREGAPRTESALAVYGLVKKKAPAGQEASRSFQAIHALGLALLPLAWPLVGGEALAPWLQALVWTGALLSGLAAVSFPPGFIAWTVRGRVEKGWNYHFLAPWAQADVFVEETWHSLSTSLLPFLNSSSLWALPFRALDEMIAKTVALAWPLVYFHPALREERRVSRLAAALAPDEVIEAQLAGRTLDLGLENLDHRLASLENAAETLERSPAYARDIARKAGVRRGTSPRAVWEMLWAFVLGGRWNGRSLTDVLAANEGERFRVVAVDGTEDVEALVAANVGDLGEGVALWFVTATDELAERVNARLPLTPTLSQEEREKSTAIRAIAVKEAFDVEGFFALKPVHERLAGERAYGAGGGRIVSSASRLPDPTGLPADSPLRLALAVIFRGMDEAFQATRRQLESLDRVARAVASAA